MTTRSKILSLLLVFVLVLFSVFAVACDRNKDNGDGGDQTQTKTEWPEAGVYYFDAGNDEYTLTLNVGDTFVLYIKGNNQSGNYTLTDTALELDFNAEGKENVTANYEGNVISLTYEGASLRLLKKLPYTVSFNTNGGNAISPVTVINGKTVAKPEDPTRAGYIFIGWYKDSEFKTAYTFGAEPVTEDTEIYARWVAAGDSETEYSAKLDPNYDGAAALGTVNTTGGQLLDLPTPERTGYTFGGWWFSSENDGNKLSYRYESGMTLSGNTTLYAFWQLIPTDGKLADPIVNVTAGNISWSNVGARSYAVKVIAPDGSVIVDETTASTTMNIAFGSYAAGTYEIRVVANAQSGEHNNSESVRFYTNKALNKVSVFNVVGSTLIFNTVENAEKYLVTVVCGNPDHEHTAFDNGSSRTFSFANCTMTENGISFTVTAVADGYASSTSEVFTFVRNLDAVTGLRFDAATEILTWNEVANAESYMVSVKCGNADHNHDFVNFGTQNFVSLKECVPCDGGIVVKVYPKSNGYNSPAAAEYVYNKTTLSTPQNVLLNGTLLTWNNVEGASGYEVKVNGTTYNTATNSFDLSSLLNWVEGSEYTFSVRASGSNASLWTEEVTARYYEMGELVTYSKSTLTWAPVIGAQFYEVRVNGGEIITVNGGATSAKVALTRAGSNTVEVRFADGQTRSDWVSVSVVAHKVTFDTLGGSYVAPQYKAVGDLMEITAPAKTGYTFVNWYNVPGGAASNGMAYTDEYFTESGAIVLYAYYSANKFEITYNYGEGGNGTLTTDEVYYESDFTLTVPTSSNVAGAFGGWFSAPYGTGTQYTDEKGNSLAPWTALEGKELYAFWIDEALKFTATKVNGKDVYAVSKGSRIDLVTEVTVPAYYKGVPVAVIAGNAFQNCSNLKAINLPATIEQISMITPFGGCSSLEALNVYAVDGVNAPVFTSIDGVLFETGSNGAASKIVLMPLAKTGTYRIPAGITEIPEAAFAGSAITKVVIPASVTKIGRDAFSGCTKLSSVVFEAAAQGESEQSLMISARAFNGCTALEKIILPARLTDIKLQKSNITGNNVTVDNAENAFLGCTGLVSITVASNNANYKSVNGVLYSKDGKTLLYCPATVTGVFTVPAGTLAVAPGAFVGCTGITEVLIPNTVTLVGDAAFFGLSALTKVTFQGNAFSDLTVGKYAFRDCTTLTDIVFEENSRVAVLSEGAFKGCYNLETVTIPATMTSVKAEAFSDCEDLSEVIFAANGKTLAFGENVFYNCTSLESVSLPANVSAIPGVFSGCTSLTEVNVDPASEYFTSIDGVVFNKAETEILFFPQGKTGEYTLPATVTNIANGVFSGVTKLTTLNVSNTLVAIGDEAFKGAELDAIVFTGEATGSLTIGASAFEEASVGELNLPAHVTVIGNNAFANFEADTFSVSEGVTELGDYAFYNADVKVTVPTTVKSIGSYCFSTEGGWYGYYADVTFAEGSQLEYIGTYAFSGNGIKTFVLPASVKTIDAYAFYECEDLGSFTFAANSTLETIGAYAFSASSSWYGNSISEITIPKSVTSIGAYAFSATALEAVYFEEGGTKDLVIGTPYKYSYVDYNDMTQTKILSGHTFYDAMDLETVVLPARLTEIGESTFEYAGYYTTLSVTIDQTLETSRLATIGERAFASSRLVSFVIPKSVRNLDPVLDPVSGEMKDRIGIGAEAFDGCYSKFTSVTFEMGGTAPLTIGENAFYNCDLLTEMQLPARLAPYTSHTGEVIAPLANGAGVFEESFGIASVSVEVADNAYLASLEGVLYTSDMKQLVYYPASREGAFVVPASVTEICEKAFLHATKLTALTFAEGSAVKTIGNNAFEECIVLETLVLPDTLTTLGEEVFYNCEALVSLTLSANLEGFNGDMITGCDALAAINVGSNGTGVNFSSIDGVLYNTDATALVLYPGAKTETEFVLPASVKYIANSAFANNSILVKVVLNDGLIEIGERAFFYTSIQEVYIPSTVQLIDRSAFANSSKLTNVTFAEGGTDPLVIKYEAFYYTRNMGAVAFPARLAIIDARAFNNAGITEITFAEGSALTDIGYSAFVANKFTRLALPAGLVTIGNEAFNNCGYLETVTIGEGLVSMGNSVFSNDLELRSISFPASLKTMGVNTFYYYDYGDKLGASKLETVTFPENAQLEAIPSGTFAFSGLKSFVVPASVKAILGKEEGATQKEYPGAFEGAANLELISFEDGTVISSIGESAFYDCTSLKFVTIPATVSTLGDYAFYNCESLLSIVIPETTTNLGGFLFQSCDELSSVTLATKATELPEYMFASCGKLTSIVIPETVTKIGSACFDATAITEITLPSSVTDLSGYNIFSRNEVLEKVVITGDVTLIGREMFKDCTALSEIVLPSTVETISEGAFTNCVRIESFKIPKALTTLESAFSGTSLKEYTVEEGNTKYAAFEGVLFNADKTEIISYPVNKSSATFTVPKEVKFIGAGTFAGVNTLNTVVFEEGGTEPLTIGDEAFADMTSIVKVVFPERLDKIGDEAFAYCVNLSSINIPASMDENDFGDYCFYNCIKLVEIKNESAIELEAGDETCGGIAANAVRIYTEGESMVSSDENGFVTLTSGEQLYLLGYAGTLTDITLPTGITDIYPYAFYGFNVTSVVIPEGVKTIGEGVFYDCDKLTSVTLPTTLKSIGDGVFYYCYDLVDVVLPEGLESIGERAFYYCSDLTTIVVPASVTEIGYYGFGNCSSLTLFVKASAKPDGWDSSWKSSSIDVLWGYTGENITYTFNSNGGSAVDSITSDLPINLPEGPTLAGYVFVGWYDNEALEGTALSGQYYNGEKTTLYAKFMTEEQYQEEMLRGKSMDFAHITVSGKTYDVNIEEERMQNYFMFTVEAGETWHITTGGSGDHKIFYYNGDQSSKGSYDSGYSEDYNYTFSEAGTYYIGVGYYSNYVTGSFTVTFTKQ